MLHSGFATININEEDPGGQMREMEREMGGGGGDGNA